MNAITAISIFFLAAGPLLFCGMGLWEAWKDR